MRQDIIDCELAYTACFSKAIETSHGIQFIDVELLDMYDHNYTYLSIFSKEIMKQAILNRFKTQDYCKLVTYEPLTEEVANREISLMGFYQFDLAQIFTLKGRSDLVIKPLKDVESVSDLIRCDLAHDEQTLGIDFCTRRATRRSKIYLKNERVNCYLCY